MDRLLIFVIAIFRYILKVGALHLLYQTVHTDIGLPDVSILFWAVIVVLYEALSLDMDIDDIAESGDYMEQAYILLYEFVAYIVLGIALLIAYIIF